MDLDYFAYLVKTVPPLDLASALVRRARNLLRGRVRDALQRHARPLLRLSARRAQQRQRRLALPARPAQGALLLPEAREATAQLLRERFPAACEAVLAEARAAREGVLPVFGRATGCALVRRGPGEPCAPLALDLDPLTGAHYDPEVPGPRVDLFVPGADAKAAWEVGRLTHLWRYGQARWLAPTAEERSSWARAYLHTLRQFRAACPAGYGVQWSCAMEVSARAMHAALAFGLVCDDPVIDASARAEVLAMLQQHGELIEGNLEDSGAVRTNHYAADLVGLVVMGALFPELPSAARWRGEAAAMLWDEIPRQVRADGTHFESSTGYQRLCAELFLVATLAARAGGMRAPPRVEEAVASLFRSLGELTKPSGRTPQIGDFDSCRGLPLQPRAALDFGYLAPLGAAALCDPRLKAEGEACPSEVAWLCGAAGVGLFEALPGRRSRKGRVLPEAGIAVLREGSAYVALSAGPNGQGGCGGHAHNDKNSVELEWRGRDVVVDRGTFVYARDPAERNARRSTAAHSTVQVDGAEQSRIRPGRLFALPDEARARILGLWQRDGVELARGEHQGYQRLSPPVHHRRSAALLRLARAAAFVDELGGAGEHVLTSRFYVPHVDVRERVATDAERARLQQLCSGRVVPLALDADRCVEVRAEGGDGPLALFAFAASLPWTLQIEPTDVSPGYGERAPARCLVLHAAGEVPALLCTAVLLL